MDGKSSSASWRKPITVGFVLQNNALWKVGSWVVMLLLLLEQSYLASTINNTHLQMCYTGIRLLVQKPLENRSPKQISALLWRFTNDSSRVTRHQRLRRVSSHHAIGYPCKVNPFRISRFVIWRRGKILNIVLAYCNWIHLIIQMYIYIYMAYMIFLYVYMNGSNPFPQTHWWMTSMFALLETNATLWKMRNLPTCTWLDQASNSTKWSRSHPGIAAILIGIGLASLGLEENPECTYYIQPFWNM